VSSLDVTPSELHAAGATLRRVRSELSTSNGLGAGGMSVGDVGYGDLAAAMQDFCQMAGTTASALGDAVDRAGQRTDQAGTHYEHTESVNAAMAQ
jgi:hypothetical protein